MPPSDQRQALGGVSNFHLNDRLILITFLIDEIYYESLQVEDQEHSPCYIADFGL